MVDQLADQPANRPVIILVRPQLAENIGMCARAMANFGLSEMRLVAPRDGWPQKTRMKKGAIAAAAGATSILENAKLFATLDDAVADLHYVFATTARERGLAKPVHGPARAMAEAHARIQRGEGIGIMFGPERSGLDNDDVTSANAVISFPVNREFASLNLAQAVLLMGYEWFRHDEGGEAPFVMPHASPPAKRDTLHSFLNFLEGHLDRAGYFWPEKKRPVMIRNFRNIVHRLNASEQDLRSIRGAITWLIKRGQVAEQENAEQENAEQDNPNHDNAEK